MARPKMQDVKTDPNLTSLLDVVFQLAISELSTPIAYADLARFEVKVVPLRFTDVGPTTKTFQGRSVTIPGLEDTLRTILGLDDKVEGQATQQRTREPQRKGASGKYQDPGHQHHPTVSKAGFSTR